QNRPDMRSVTTALAAPGGYGNTGKPRRHCRERGANLYLRCAYAWRTDGICTLRLAGHGLRSMPPATNPLQPQPPASAPSTLKSHVYKALRDAIVSGRYKPGQRLNES